MRLLLLEDDDAVGEALCAGFSQHGVVADWVTRANDFEGALVSSRFDCVLLDLRLPDGNGAELLRIMRRRGDNTSVIVLTAQATRASSIDLLNIGADDYMAKPFDFNELLARIRAVVRRTQSLDRSTRVVHGPLVLQLDSMLVFWNEQLVPLTRKQFWLLELFMRNRNRVLTRQQIEEALYGWGEEAESNTIGVYIHQLRKKFSPSLFVTIRGVGYQLGSEERITNHERPHAFHALAG